MRCKSFYLLLFSILFFGTGNYLFSVDVDAECITALSSLCERGLIDQAHKKTVHDICERGLVDDMSLKDICLSTLKNIDAQQKQNYDLELEGARSILERLFIASVPTRAPRPEAPQSWSGQEPDERDLVVERDLYVNGDIYAESFSGNANFDNLTVNGKFTANNGYYFTQGVPGIPAQALQVTKGPITGPNQFSSIKAAVDSITDASQLKPYTIEVGPGVYFEDTITLKPWIALCGCSAATTFIVAIDPTQTILVGAEDAYVAQMSFEGAAAPGGIAVSFGGGGAGSVFVVTECGFASNDTQVSIVANTPPLANIVINNSLLVGTFRRGFFVDGDSGVAILCYISNLLWQVETAPALENMLYLSGPNAQAHVVSSKFYTVALAPLATGFIVRNGGHFGSTAVDIHGFALGIEVPNIGAGPYLHTQGTFITDCTQDMRVDNPNSRLVLEGIMDWDKMTIDPGVANITTEILDSETSGGIVIVGPQRVGADLASVTNISPQIEQGGSLGVITDGLLSLAGGFNVNVQAGTGYVSDPALDYVTWGATTVTIPANTTRFVYVDSNGVVQVSASSPQEDVDILLGKAEAGAVGVVYVQDMKKDAHHTSAQLDRSWRIGIGSVYATGSITSKNSPTGLKLDVSSGRYYFSTHEYTPSGGTPITFNAFLRSATPGQWVITGGVSDVDYNHYDDGSGTPALLPVNDFARHALYIVNDGAEEKYLFQYGQTVYGSLVDAQNGVIPPAPGTWSGNIALIASIIVENTGVAADQIAEIRDERPTLGFRASGVAAVTVHGDLSGLLADDHPQYLLTNGGRVLTGNLNLGGNNITNVNLVDGVDVPAHAARHLPNGADPLTTATPVTIGTSNQVGIQNSLARSDHVHNHGNLAGGSLHANVTTTVAGFMSAADKVTLDSINPANFVQKSGDTMTGDLSMGGNNITNVNLVDGVDVPAHGSRHNPGGADAVTTAAPVTIGTANAEGTATSLSRSDHVHNHGNLAGGSLHANATQVVNGFMSAADKTILDNLNPSLFVLKAGDTMTGDLSMGGNNITNVNLVDGVDVPAHGSRHNPGGADAVTTAAPVNIGTANAEGTASSLARSDHVHNHGNLAGGALHADATTTVDGFMSAADKTKLDGIDTSLYVLKAGDTMTGDLSMGGNNITNVNLVDGVDVPAHGSRHNPGGADAVTTAAPVNIGTANAEGTASSLARSDHVHNHGNLAGGALHADATTTVDGFMSAADKTKLDGIDISLYVLKAGDTMTGDLNMGGNNITNVNLVDGIDVPAHGSRHNPGGADAVTTAAPVNIGTANAEGTATSLARSDHVHNHGNLAGGTLHADATTTVDGFMSAADKTKLDGIDTSLYVLKAGDTMTGDLVMDNQLQIQLREQTASGTNYAALQAPATLAGDYTLTLPVDDGNANDVMISNGSGVLSWVPLIQRTNYKAAVYMSTTQILAASSVPETLQFDTELYDPNNNFNTGTYAYTAPVTGYYAVNVNIAADYTNAFDRYIRLLVNGSPVTGYALFWRQTDVPAGYSTVIPLTAGQTLAAQIEGRVNDDILATYSTMTIHIISV